MKICGMWIFTVLFVGSLQVSADEQLLFDFSEADNIRNAEAKGSSISLVTNNVGAAVRVDTGSVNKWPGITLYLRGGVDASAYKTATAQITNPGDVPLTVYWRIDSEGRAVEGNKNQRSASKSITLAAGETKRMRYPLFPHIDYPGVNPDEFFGMQGKPFSNRHALYLEHLRSFTFYLIQDGVSRSFEIGKIQLENKRPDENRGVKKAVIPKKIFPMIDEFGQFKHADWPGKTHSLKQLKQARIEEDLFLNKAGRPASWNRFGGWKDGPRLEATGWFRTEKYEGKWYFVDPDGNLFFSLGIDGVGFSSGTILDDREHWFECVPSDTPKNAEFWFGYKPGLKRSHWYNRDVRAFRFHKFNARRKYGENYEEEFAETACRRLPAWGINTLGNWSSPDVYLKGKLPYVAYLRPQSKRVEASQGHWGKFCDVFDEDFVMKLKKQLSRYPIAETINDPLCIGYFVDNELSFGDTVSLAVASLCSPADQKSKQVFIADLKKKYGDIHALNSVWKSEHASWDDLLDYTEAPDLEAARADLEAFYTKFVRTYFKTVHDVLEEFAPNHLYLGCRHGSHAAINDVVMQANIEYADVVSFNIYARYLSDKASRLTLAGNKPILIGEFHFGALDRGMFDGGLVPVADQMERADAFSQYVLDCVKHPNVIGCHWFQYVNSPTTGRVWDFENYQIGFTDVCDTPYSELIEASRAVGEQLYRK
ncbi:hypothetical protein EGM51_05270 [Verrucomicrobia bacterium S94]|nr:hypothetical protein EGM51_05270 [Verrucomicrobia bacterium S94]